MHILFISKNFPPAVCGVGDYTFQLAKEFIKNGHAVTVLTQKTDNTIAVQGMNILPVISSWNIKAVFKIAAICKTVKPDYISMQYVPYSFNAKGMPFWLILLYMVLKIKGFKIVTTFHEVGIRYTAKSFKRKIIAAAQFFIARILSRYSFKNITSIDLYVNYLKRYTDAVFKIPVGANILPYTVDSSTISQLRNTIAHPESFILSTFGTRISDTILMAFAEVKKQHPDTVLIILGNIPKATKQHFTSKSQELGIDASIHITGYLSDEALYTHLKLSSLFVMAEYVSEKGEGGIATKSGSLAAAFAAGIPVLGTRGDTTDAVFRDNENIFLMNDYSVDQTAKRISEIINNQAWLQTIAAEARKTFASEFSWEKIYERYWEVYSMPD
ncbi:glycosyltransferase family 4 protein [Cytophaga hutchinsonii]|uniref:A-glycosyltransferase-related protein, glycosyltransferase family 4 protein n=1 Tax=Cytophaga hutchinsonii (strain ATCC 33406 / DSM 1761 / CIP 103989 / NBRC 15051 / NCIMB 9469 / D465) TaxID=269798 RepID=A0A6N4SPB0_CYTH3|nr:glycosyltransferase family 4 protein [Cytophaga hutchinsonii]ABG58166.1 a-glycosyltransferase-related protein, glycosyltransferase family 4 protein [Cytophaga hutchinsonii ATCC 33406]SFY02752.1 Glycosyltransferase involved in cell wall bisynthesis [Cytophaga hutchinsonii ATCC 33406]